VDGPIVLESGDQPKGTWVRESFEQWQMPEKHRAIYLNHLAGVDELCRSCDLGKLMVETF
jgi:hypothetical protein